MVAIVYRLVGRVQAGCGLGKVPTVSYHCGSSTIELFTLTLQLVQTAILLLFGGGVDLEDSVQYTVSGGRVDVGTCELCFFSCLLCLCSMPDWQAYYAPTNCLLCSMFKICRKDD